MTEIGSRLLRARLGKGKALAFIATAAMCASTQAAENFTAVEVAGLPAVDTSAVAWADFDNDGRLDFLISGTTNGFVTGGIAQLWRNTGSAFTNMPVPNLEGFSGGSVSWGDYDNDNRLDFVITGSSTNLGNVVRKVQLWRNTSTGFSNVTATVIPDLAAVNQSSTAWADFNCDGKLDLLLTGLSSTGKVIQLWFNTGSGFTNATATFGSALTAVAYGAITTADFDNDGRVDVLGSGENSANQLVTQLWRNTEAGFVNASASAPGLPGTAFGSSAWGDFDRDGRLDFITTGESSTGYVAQVWRNTGSGFANYPIAGLTGITYSHSTWADFDNDGALDFLLTGHKPSAELWLNTGSGFTNSNPNLPGVYSLAGSSAAADFDNDGRLDLLMTGSTGGGRIAQLHRGVGMPVNSPAPAPTGLSTFVSNNIVTFNWSAPSDSISGTNVSFNVRVGTAPGFSDILNAQADVGSGFRRIPAIGNAQLNRSAQLKLAPGVYYWSVQAIDGAFAGGTFGPEQMFEVFPDVAPTLTIQPSGANVILSWQPPIPGWILQENTTITGTWSNSPSGSLNPVSVTKTNAQKFFRLYRP